ncbi:MAG: hypothetical protein Q7T21_08630 [Gallionella sp.]|nr:hypothetical protein [Gallionella sp.]
MQVELQAELFRRYPKFFRKPGKRLVDPEIISDVEARLQDDAAPFDERGIECGDDWFALIDRLSRACELEIETLIAQGVPKEYWPRIAQIKEKFGGLRFYVNGPVSEELRAKILQAENKESPRICEVCGAPGKLREGRLRRTYCDSCDAESEAKRRH